VGVPAGGGALGEELVEVVEGLDAAEGVVGGVGGGDGDGEAAGIVKLWGWESEGADEDDDGGCGRAATPGVTVRRTMASSRSPSPRAFSTARVSFSALGGVKLRSSAETMRRSRCWRRRKTRPL